MLGLVLDFPGSFMHLEEINEMWQAEFQPYASLIATDGAPASAREVF